MFEAFKFFELSKAFDWWLFHQFLLLIWAFRTTIIYSLQMLSDQLIETSSFFSSSTYIVSYTPLLCVERTNNICQIFKLNMSYEKKTNNKIDAPEGGGWCCHSLTKRPNHHSLHRSSSSRWVRWVSLSQCRSGTVSLGQSQSVTVCLVCGPCRSLSQSVSQ